MSIPSIRFHFPTTPSEFVCAFFHLGGKYSPLALLHLHLMGISHHATCCSILKVHFMQTCGHTYIHTRSQSATTKVLGTIAVHTKTYMVEQPAHTAVFQVATKSCSGYGAGLVAERLRPADFHNAERLLGINIIKLLFSCISRRRSNGTGWFGAARTTGK